jgi:hypothetical protein
MRLLSPGTASSATCIPGASAREGETAPIAAMAAIAAIEAIHILIVIPLFLRETFPFPLKDGF